MGMFLWCASFSIAEITVTFRQDGSNVVVNAGGIVSVDNFQKTEISSSQATQNLASGGISTLSPYIHFGFTMGQYSLFGRDVYNAESNNSSFIYPTPISATPNNLQLNGSFISTGNFSLTTDLSIKGFSISFVLSPTNVGLQIIMPKGITQLESETIFLNKQLEEFFAPEMFGTTLKIVKALEPSFVLASVSIIPEPSSLSLLLAGGLVALARRRKA